MAESILITGACGQLGSELTLALREIHGTSQVIATDIREPEGELAEGPFELLNVLDKDQIAALISKYKITRIFHLAAILSAKGEQMPLKTWDINMASLLNILELSRLNDVQRVYWPSSIAVFGPDTPRVQTPQNTTLTPTTVYGISKRAGELWCQYYFDRYGLDVRSLRYPGLISYKTLPGGGTTDYAIDIFFKAVAGEKYSCFLGPDTRLPMMHMPDAIRATLELMDAPAEKVQIHSSYNLNGLDFTPAELAAAIQKEVPGFEIDYNPDFRQKIADSWPDSIDDSAARADWGWEPQFKLKELVTDMLENIRKYRASQLSA